MLKISESHSRFASAMPYLAIGIFGLVICNLAWWQEQALSRSILGRWLVTWAYLQALTLSWIALHSLRWLFSRFTDDRSALLAMSLLIYPSVSIGSWLAVEKALKLVRPNVWIRAFLAWLLFQAVILSLSAAAGLYRI
ncbi:MAG TPA: hypothetical protein VOA87_09465 [Thermoanaerobaculia bacterium]|nr:hypothetical protein [Thermoanaerobaculia bacterium]